MAVFVALWLVHFRTVQQRQDSMFSMTSSEVGGICDFWLNGHSVAVKDADIL